MREKFLFGFLFLIFSTFLYSQVSAPQYFKKIMEKYDALKDFEASVSLTIAGVKQAGKFSYLFPDKFMLQLTNNEQVFVSDGKTLMVYVPSLGTTFIQNLPEKEESKHLFEILSSEYSISYESSPKFEPLDELILDPVIKLTFTRKVYVEVATVNKYIIAFNRDFTIRRVYAYTTNNNSELIIDFNSINTNVGILESKFKYDPPKSSNKVYNFLYDN